MLRIASGVALCTFTVLSGCSQGPDGEPLGESRSAIVNGSPDTTHTAAVYLDNGCTGTIVQVSGTIGYVLTAGHCCTVENTPPANVIIANDFSTATTSETYPVIASSVQWHPDFDDSTGQYDFCMMQFSGAASTTPVIPVMTPAEDNLAEGSVVDFVGYGNTSENDSSNTVRRQIQGPISSVDSLFLYYNTGGTGTDPINGGPCDGDSGGPALTTSGTLLVAGVTSDGPDNCAGPGAYSGRVSAVYAQFIAPYLGISSDAGTAADAGELADAGTPDAGEPVDAGATLGSDSGSVPDSGDSPGSNQVEDSGAPSDPGSTPNTPNATAPSDPAPSSGGCNVSSRTEKGGPMPWFVGLFAGVALILGKRTRRSSGEPFRSAVALMKDEARIRSKRSPSATTSVARIR